MAEYPCNPQSEHLLLTLREMLAGYAAANEFMEAERIQRLAAMTDEEARALDRDLYAGWYALPAWTKEGLESLEPLQLESLLTMRLAFQRMAEAEGYL